MHEPEIIQFKLTHEKGRPIFELLHPATDNTTDQQEETNPTESLNILAEDIEITQKWLLLDSPMNIHHQGLIVGTMEFVWTNDIVVYLKDTEGNPKIYQIISKGFFNRYFILQDAFDEVLFRMDRVQKENIVESKAVVEEGVDDRMLLVLFGYGIDLIRWR